MQSYENHTAKFPLQHFVWLPLSALSLIALIVYLFTSNTLLQTSLMTITLIIAIIGGCWHVYMSLNCTTVLYG
ncbi:hypothetical protein BN1050_01083 [Metalysinibacillus saudimassiliensis]|uniref:Uncharacterized protein n=1 Tax=Metalysinibacillus saudimassiliensis TaxID=1461583 RepID=A0A078M6R3_9BACL|nr:hypothetical protein BN1050_01083 [Metalysinibacillus saudimassiliensis]